jgi:hypothetical protein
VRTKNCNNPMFVPENRQCRGVLELNGHAPQRCASLLLNCLQTATTLLAGSWPAFPKVLISSLTASICSCFGLFQDASSIH